MVIHAERNFDQPVVQEWQTRFDRMAHRIALFIPEQMRKLEAFDFQLLHLLDIPVGLVQLPDIGELQQILGLDIGELASQPADADA